MSASDITPQTPLQPPLKSEESLERSILVEGNATRSVFASTFGNNAMLSFGDTYYSSAVLLEQELYLIHSRNSEITDPSNAGSLIEALRTRRLVILSAPAYWRQSYVAEYLADQMIASVKTSIPAGDDKPAPPKTIYTLASEASGSAFLDALRDNTKKLKGAVILASSVRAEKYAGSLLTELARQAAHRGAYIILTTEEDRIPWSHAAAEDVKYFFDLPDLMPYTPEDFAQWLIGSSEVQAYYNKYSKAKERLIPASELGDQTISAIGRELGSPGAIQRFLTAIRDVEPETIDPETNARWSVAGNVSRIKKEEKQSAQRRIEDWFDKLKPPERYLVLAISLLDGLRQETFWAVYEQLTQLAWRERDMQLAMSDYHDIKAKLDEFVSAASDQVRFHNAEERRTLVTYALNSYRRSLVQALPVLADIVSGASHPLTTDSGSLAGRLRTLDIFGSELEPTGENRQRQERLRNSIANSIAQVAQREPATTQHLLLAWASGVSEADSSVVNTRLRIAVTITLVQMLTIESPRTDTSLAWYQRHTAFELLNEWYQRYLPGSTTYLSNQTGQATEERHRNIRATMALALCHLGRQLPVELFGSLGGGASLRHDRIPAEQPQPGDLNSLWEMLLALAWDPESEVRASMIEGIPVLMQRHNAHAEALILLLASDWRSAVREQLAEMLAALFNANSSNMLLINHLLYNDAPLVQRNLSTVHYLRREAVSEQDVTMLQRWTGIMALFHIADRSEAAFCSFLQTYFASMVEAKDLEQRYSALSDVTNFVLTNDTLRQRFADSALLYMLTDARSQDNRPTRSNRIIREQLRAYVGYGTIKRNLNWLGSEIGAHLTGRYPRLPEPTPAELKRELANVTISAPGVLALVDHYTRSSDVRVRRQMQQVLHPNATD